MSKTIIVTAQMNDPQRVIRFPYVIGSPFFACLCDALVREDVSFSLCGGKGICGKCRIRFVKNAPLPTAVERRFLTADELRSGIRLACKCMPRQECEIEVLFEQNTRIITSYILEEQDFGHLSSTMQAQEFVVTADVGTTTIAMAVTDSATGSVIATYSCMNPQRVYGADIIARIEAARENGGARLQELVLDALSKGYQKMQTDLVQSGKAPELSKTIYVAANTTMSHFLAGCDAAGLGEAPFIPEFLDKRELDYSGFHIVILPGISAFVGGDIVAGLLSSSMLPIRDQERGTLFIDLGTNGEMVLSDGKRLYCTSAAAGPAFEGVGANKQGSHMIERLAKMLRCGQMDETGLLLSEKTDMDQMEIRNLQMAKAAVRSGIEVLLEKAGMTIDHIRSVYLAGGFGFYLDVNDAIEIGLVPDSFAEHTISVGNASLYGAYCYRKWIEKGNEEELEQALRANCVSVNLASEPVFQERFIDWMDFRKRERS